MKDKSTERWDTYESFYVELSGKKVADIVITNHARMRWIDRIEPTRSEPAEIAAFMWECLKQGRIEPSTATRMMFS